MAKQKNMYKACPPAKQSKSRVNKKEDRIILIVSVCLALILLGILGRTIAFSIGHSSWYTRAATAVIADNEELSVVDYNFFFYRSYYEFLNKVGSSSAGLYSTPDPSVPLDRQYMDTENTVTWKEYFDSRAKSLISETFAFYHMAQREGFTLTQEMQDRIAYDYDEKVWFEAEEVNGSTCAKYLATNYGAGMTEEIYKKNLTILYTAIFFKEQFKQNITIDDAELDRCYAEKNAHYRTVFYQLFYISGTSDTDPPVTMFTAKQHAEVLAKETTLEGFIARCKEYTVYNEGNSYWQKESILRREQAWTSISYLRDWLQQERRYGDTAIAEASNGYYVAFFIEANDNDYATANLKYFTISGENAREDAGAFLAEFGQSEKSVLDFFNLSNGFRDKDYSSADVNRIDSITFDNMTLASVPEPAIDWVFGEKRQEGDVKVFAESAEKVYVIYYDGSGMKAKRYLVYKEMSNTIYNEWESDMTKNIPYTTRGGYALTATGGVLNAEERI